MTDEREDLELQALERQLDDAFASTRPRRDFEDELWTRMQARRPVTSRLRDALAALAAGFREAPAIPLGAVALVLIVALGIGVFASGGLHLNQGSSTSGAFSQAAPAPADLRAGDFGRLPTPALHPGATDKTPPLALAPGPQSPTYAAAPPSNLYFGPANLRWTGQLPVLVQAPVYRYREPTAGDADRFAGSIGASRTSQPSSGDSLGTYSGQDFTVSVRGSVPSLPREPVWVLTPAPGTGPLGVDAAATAESLLARYSLVPAWPNDIDVRNAGGPATVQFLRKFPLAQGGYAYLVDWNGQHYGIQVNLQDGKVTSADGPMPLALDSAGYRLISNDAAVRLALSSAPAASQGVQPQPTVNLSDVQLVYALAVSNGQGFYEPAYLFSGTFQYNGQTYTKRVLVPLVDPSQRTS